MATQVLPSNSRKVIRACSRKDVPKVITGNEDTGAIMIQQMEVRNVEHHKRALGWGRGGERDWGHRFQ